MSRFKDAFFFLHEYSTIIVNLFRGWGRKRRRKIHVTIIINLAKF